MSGVDFLASVVLPVTLGVLTFAGAVIGKRAMGRKTTAEAKKTEVDTIRSLLDDVMKVYDRQKQDHAEERAEDEREKAVMRAQIHEMDTRLAQTIGRQHVLIAALAAHAAWDRAAIAALRTTMADYPEPPPIQIEA